MDAESMLAHLQDLLAGERDTLERLEAHKQKLLTHHESKERGRALRQVQSSIRRHDKMRRRFERAIEVQEK